MSARPKEAAKTSACETNIKDLLANFIDNKEPNEALVGALWEITIRLVLSLPTNQSGGGKALSIDEARDIASDFLLQHIRAGNRRQIYTKTALKMELRKFMTKMNDPQGIEFWRVLSEALRRLAEESLVRRVDAPLQRRNTNASRWTVADPAKDTKVLDLQAFWERCKNIPFFPPARENGRVVAPVAARDLVLALLKAAQGPIEFGILFEEAKAHVQPITMIVAPDRFSSEDEPCAAGDTMLETDFAFVEEAEERAGRMWARIPGKKGERVLCIYILPKYFLEKKTRLEDLGNPRRVNEASQQILDVMREELTLDQVASDRLDRPEAWDDSPGTRIRLAMIHAVAQLLVKKCSEKGFDMNFTENDES